ncbi:MAG TPA: hypothetical protein VKX17_17160 [Planctomycetota bacterium]|nr:hypothetical protein [Planctomycetota bacterium]
MKQVSGVRDQVSGVSTKGANFDSPGRSPGSKCVDVPKALKGRTKACAAFFFALALGFSAHSAEDTPENEAKQFEQEEKDALEKVGKDYLLYSDFTGKLTLYTKEEIDANGDATVIGKFQMDKTIVLVKAMSDDLKTKLQPLHKKTCTLSGKIRNDGKYLYVKALTPSGPENTYKGRKGGL